MMSASDGISLKYSMASTTSSYLSFAIDKILQKIVPHRRGTSTPRIARRIILMISSGIATPNSMSTNDVFSTFLLTGFQKRNTKKV